ncbi:MAG: DUF1549 and DUF1553 domain-containing protein [Verrucomicrobiota bacterium]
MAAALKTLTFLLFLGLTAHADNDSKLLDKSRSQKQEWWSLRPLTKPELPKVKDTAWLRTPIDQFILAKLEEKKLNPSLPADKRSLLRRVYFDLIGLPPTPEEMETFLRDNSRDAYEKVVDHLLASPCYGERWARHWLDVVHYAETHGNDQDRVRTNAWPYRDYVIRSFNDDKPYARFVEEQIAGDVLFPDDPQGVIAMGCLATGPWDESSLRDIQEDTIDRKIARYLDRDDIVMTVMNTFVSATVQCARCHNHKFDPIAQSEYYGLQAVFAATDKGNRPYDPDFRTHVARQSLLKQKAALDLRPKRIVDELLSPATQSAVAVWEKSLSTRPSIWTVLDPESFTSSGGATLTKQSDSSLLASGARPEVDTYTIVARTDLKGITAARLEVLPHDSLPHNGPGRQDNGNLHLSEFHLSIVAQTDPTATNRPVALQNASADFNQQDWGIEKAIDGKTNTAWGIYPEVGKSHLAAFETKEDAGVEGGAKLTFVLEQKHGGGHLIGRLRLSATTASRPVRANPFPETISKILATAAEQRSDEQRIELAAYYRREQLDKELAALPPPRIVYAGASDFIPDASFKPVRVPRPIYVLKRGDINKPGELASPGALACVSTVPSRFELSDPSDEGSRRAALAKWIVDPRNPLTWRSIVNRVWHYHFGRGIVDSPNDFGRMGGQPTHPELLDWLAATFLESGGSLKQLHRLIVTSATYQQSSLIPVGADVRRLSSNAQRETPNSRQENPNLATSGAADPLELDADNRYLWRMNRSRLDAESVRDAVLQITGRLDLTMGGPSVQQFLLSPGIHVTPVVDYGKFDVDSRESCRRSIYRFIFRTLPDPFMDSLDCADSSQLTAARTASVTALQALSMLNNHFVVRQSEHFADRVSKMGKDLDSQIAAAYQLALERRPTKTEADELAGYAAKYGMANLCRLILNSNEFMFIN